MIPLASSFGIVALVMFVASVIFLTSGFLTYPPRSPKNETSILTKNETANSSSVSTVATTTGSGRTIRTKSEEPLSVPDYLIVTGIISIILCLGFSFLACCLYKNPFGDSPSDTDTDENPVVEGNLRGAACKLTSFKQKSTSDPQDIANEQPELTSPNMVNRFFRRLMGVAPDHENPESEMELGSIRERNIYEMDSFEEGGSSSSPGLRSSQQSSSPGLRSSQQSSSHSNPSKEVQDHSSVVLSRTSLQIISESEGSNKPEDV